MLLFGQITAIFSSRPGLHAPLKAGKIVTAFQSGGPLSACLWTSDILGDLALRKPVSKPFGRHLGYLLYVPGSTYPLCFSAWAKTLAKQGTSGPICVVGLLLCKHHLPSCAGQVFLICLNLDWHAYHLAPI